MANAFIRTDELTLAKVEACIEKLTAREALQRLLTYILIPNVMLTFESGAQTNNGMWIRALAQRVIKDNNFPKEQFDMFKIDLEV